MGLVLDEICRGAVLGDRVEAVRVVTAGWVYFDRVLTTDCLREALGQEVGVSILLDIYESLVVPLTHYRGETSIELDDGLRLMRDVPWHDMRSAILLNRLEGFKPAHVQVVLDHADSTELSRIALPRIELRLFVLSLRALLTG